MKVYEMRQRVTNVYPGNAWAKKVRKMTDLQVFAIHTRFMKEGKLK